MSWHFLVELEEDREYSILRSGLVNGVCKLTFILS